MSEPLNITPELRRLLEEPAALAELWRELKVTPHPVIALPHAGQVVALLVQPEGKAKLLDVLAKREKSILLADEEGGDPFRYGIELPHWTEADADLKAQGRGQYCSGGKRATKSERAAWRVVQAAVHLPKSIIWCLQANLETSIATQQKMIWKYLPLEIKAMNGRKRHG